MSIRIGFVGVNRRTTRENAVNRDSLTIKTAKPIFSIHNRFMSKHFWIHRRALLVKGMNAPGDLLFRLQHNLSALNAS